jgi:hypothetical protein
MRRTITRRRSRRRAADDSHLEPIKGNDHRLDALRYAVMERFWDPVMEELRRRSSAVRISRRWRI